jgi:hypothetical protein
MESRMAPVLFGDFFFTNILCGYGYHYGYYCYGYYYGYYC